MPVNYPLNIICTRMFLKLASTKMFYTVTGRDMSAVGSLFLDLDIKAVFSVLPNFMEHNQGTHSCP